MRLTKQDLEILEVLDEHGGFTTRDVAKQITMFGSNARQHSGATRAWLMNLRKRGLVDFLDDQKPACWTRTDAGSRIIREPAATDIHKRGGER